MTRSAKLVELRPKSTDRLNTLINVFLDFFTVTYSFREVFSNLASYLEYDLHLHTVANNINLRNCALLLYKDYR